MGDIVGSGATPAPKGVESGNGAVPRGWSATFLEENRPVRNWHEAVKPVLKELVQKGNGASKINGQSVSVSENNKSGRSAGEGYAYVSVGDTEVLVHKASGTISKVSELGAKVNFTVDELRSLKDGPLGRAFPEKKAVERADPGNVKTGGTPEQRIAPSTGIEKTKSNITEPEFNQAMKPTLDAILKWPEGYIQHLVGGSISRSADSSVGPIRGAPMERATAQQNQSSYVVFTTKKGNSRMELTISEGQIRAFKLDEGDRIKVSTPDHRQQIWKFVDSIFKENGVPAPQSS